VQLAFINSDHCHYCGVLYASVGCLYLKKKVKDWASQKSSNEVWKGLLIIIIRTLIVIVIVQTFVRHVLLVITLNLRHQQLLIGQDR